MKRRFDPVDDGERMQPCLRNYYMQGCEEEAMTPTEVKAWFESVRAGIDVTPYERLIVMRAYYYAKDEAHIKLLEQLHAISTDKTKPLIHG